MAVKIRLARGGMKKAPHYRIVVQDERTSVVWGMPGHVAEAGLADAILPLELVAEEIVRRVTGKTDLRAWGT